MLSALILCAGLAQAGASEAPMPAASSDVEADVDRALRVLAQDPPVGDVQKAAVDYFRVNQGDLTYYRTVSRLRALLPTLSGSYTYSSDGVLGYSNDRIATGVAYDPNNPQTVTTNTTVGRAYGASASWNLQSLIFDSSQLDTYALVGIHEDLVKEVTRLYYTRQHNMLAFSLSPPGDARARAALIVRTREIESMLDALTGNAWTKLKTQYRGTAQASNAQPNQVRQSMPAQQQSNSSYSGYQQVPPPRPGGASTQSRVRR
ncbi:MAG: hypothetical protein H7Z43_05360 [Clostridia bacterium]|nr:hypothetical protein [Deltaproteobacteria bacterium]